ncbi:hypothetical protein D3C87_1853940 [compost metagenome]
MLHDREADQQHDQHQAAAQRRLDDVIVEPPADRQPSAEQPDDEQCPCRHQQNSPVVAVYAEIEDQDDADRRRQREGKPRDA